MYLAPLQPTGLQESISLGILSAPEDVTESGLGRIMAVMLSVIAGIALSTAVAGSTPPSDDVWVYAHAASQDEDPFLRVWGNADYSVGTPSAGSFDFSFSLLRFQAKTSGPIKKLVLTLYHVADPAWEVEDAKKAPPELRLAPEGFRESSWKFSEAAKYVPGAEDKDILAKGVVGERVEEKPIKFTFTISDPVKAEQFFQSLHGRGLNFAITTRMNPEGMGEGRTYKFYSRNADEDKKELRPTLSWE